MALLKAIELGSGVTVNYHRVVSVDNITNQESLIEVASYTSKAKRLEEKAALAAKTPMNVFIDTGCEAVAYNKTLDVDGAYAYLKTLDKFTGYTDDLD